MLDIFRKASQTWIVKLLLALLTFGFMSWGVGDVIRRGAFGTGPAIEVAGNQFSASDVDAQFRREIDRLQPMLGGKLTPEEARKMGLMDRAIESIVNKTLVSEAGRDLGLAASDDLILAKVANDPNLRDDKGVFDRERLRRALARAGLTEEGFLREQRVAMIRGQVGQAVEGGVSIPASLVDPIVARRMERRTADWTQLDDKSVPAPAAPAEADLEQYYKVNAQRFMAPEYRALTVLLLRPSDVENDIQISDDMVDEAWHQRQDEFNTPERRQVSQIMLADEAEANKVRALLKSGKDFAAVAKALGAQVLDLGSIEKNDLPEELAGPVFGAAAGALVGPVQSPLGWHLAKVATVIPGKTATLTDVHERIVAGIRRDRAGDLLGALANKVEDALGGGASLEEAGKRFNLQVATFPALDAQGKDGEGRPANNLPKAEAFLDVAFHAEVGSESQLTENGNDGFFMLRVDKVTPPQARPLAAVRSDVAAALIAERRHAAARERAEKLAKSVEDGAPISSASAAMGLTVKTSRPFPRVAAEGQDLPSAAIGALFEKTAGQVAVAESGAGWVIARLAGVQPFDAKAHPEIAAKIGRELAQTVANDLDDQFLGALAVRYNVKIDRSQVTRTE